MSDSLALQCFDLFNFFKLFHVKLYAKHRLVFVFVFYWFTAIHFFQVIEFGCIFNNYWFFIGVWNFCLRFRLWRCIYAQTNTLTSLEHIFTNICRSQGHILIFIFDLCNFDRFLGSLIFLSISLNVFTLQLNVISDHNFLILTFLGLFKHFSLILY